VRFATFAGPGGRRASGAVVDGAVHPLPGGATVDDLLGDGFAARLAEAHDDAVAHAQPVPLAGLTLLPPIEPRSVRDFYAFEQHVRTARERRGLEMDPLWYDLPVFYFSNTASIVGDGATVCAPPGCAELDYELEVAAVIGCEGADLDEAAAADAIAGFTVMNDWSARDLQRAEMRLNLGPAKGKDFATSLGPFLVTPDELADRRTERAYDLAMTAAVNGEEWSRGNLADLHFSFGRMIAHASRGTRVLPGDVVGSGTCGTGCILELALVHGADRYPWLAPGDEVALTVERLGTLRNRVGARAAR
jgi:2-keto-4-pentenoate hydratase/2-oxohepta-3-ene-1,7-dioic acid hydratase in catechol pathway